MACGVAAGMLLVLPHYQPRAPRRASALGHALPSMPSVLRETNGMVWIPPGTFTMGSREGGPEERPVREETVTGFWMDRTEVTNEQFRRFVEATGYVTLAERQHATNTGLGGLVGEIVNQGGVAQMSWRIVPGASWRQPFGKDAGGAISEKQPVVQVAWEDAQAYARWADKRLPTEAEWERAARGGFERQRFVWGGERLPGGKPGANYRPSPPGAVASDSFETLAPVASFAANGFGLVDMAGNAAEWCDDGSGSSATGGSGKPIRGGSFLSELSDCRPAWRARHPAAVPRSDLGFRCVKNGP